MNSAKEFIFQFTQKPSKHSDVTASSESICEMSESPFHLHVPHEKDKWWELWQRRHRNWFRDSSAGRADDFRDFQEEFAGRRFAKNTESIRSNVFCQISAFRELIKANRFFCVHSRKKVKKLSSNIRSRDRYRQWDWFMSECRSVCWL